MAESQGGRPKASKEDIQSLGEQLDRRSTPDRALSDRIEEYRHRAATYGLESCIRSVVSEVASEVMYGPDAVAILTALASSAQEAHRDRVDGEVLASCARCGRLLNDDVESNKICVMEQCVPRPEHWPTEREALARPLFMMYLCESERLVLSSAYLYAFVVKPGCKRCEEMAQSHR